MEDHFVHLDNVEPSLFKSMKVEDDNIVDLSKTSKEELQLTFNLQIKPNNTIKSVQQNQVEEAPAIIDMIMPIHVEEIRLFLKKIWLQR